MHVLDGIDAGAIREWLAADEFFWVDLESPGGDELAALGDLLRLHPLAIEDSAEFGQRPKIDEYDDKVLIVFFAAQGEEPVEVHLHVSGSWVVTVRRTRCEALDTVRKRLSAGSVRSEEEALYRVLDGMTDSFFPLIERWEDGIDALEDAMLDRPSAGQLEDLFALRRSVGPTRRRIAEQRDMLGAGGALVTRLPGFHDDAAHDYFRDVYDHLIRIVSELDTLRDRLTGAMELHLSNQSNRLNEVMKQLTVISTIFLPLAFVTGFFGQNFGWLVGHIDTLSGFLLLGVGGLVVPCVVLWVYFRRAGFLTR